MSLTSDIMMVRPAFFDANPKTASTNEFQQQEQERDPSYSCARACYEFDRFVALLRAHDISPRVIQDEPFPAKPDAVFSNNWISTHANGTIFLYPMSTTNRQAERNPVVVNMLKKNFHVKKIIDLSKYEPYDCPLEGTGSLVFDRKNNYFYASLSARTHPDALDTFIKHSGFRPIVFNARSRRGNPYYHTNIMMSIGDPFALICLESIVDLNERRKVIRALEQTGKEIIEISIEQTENYFVGNTLLLKNKKGKKLLIISSQARQSLTLDQRSKLAKHTKLLPLSIPFIEAVGGGSVRCMITEIFLPKKQSRTKKNKSFKAT